MTGLAALARCVALVVPGVVLAVFGTGVPARVREVLSPGRGAAFEDALVDLAVIVACLTSGWLVVVTALTLTLTAQAPVQAARVARLAPRLWRDTVLVLVGLSVVAVPGSAQARSDAPSGPDGSPAPVAGLRLPDRPSPDGLRARESPRDTEPDRHTVTVRPGDTLWSIAASEAGPGADDSDAGVARRCAAWYAANRPVIGDDPDLILPGTSLQSPPPPDEGST